MREAERGADSFIVDSSMFTIEAYRGALGCDPQPDLLRQSAYDMLLYCPLSTAATYDGFRFLENRATVDRWYRELTAGYFGGRLVELPWGPERIEVATAAIRSLGP